MAEKNLGNKELRLGIASMTYRAAVLNMLKDGFLSNFTGIQSSVLISIYPMYIEPDDEMTQIVNEIDVVLARLESAGFATAISKSLSAVLLLPSIDIASVLKRTAPAVRPRHMNQLSWEIVTADLVRK